MKLEVIKQYWREAIKLSSTLQPNQQFSTSQFVAYLNELLPPDCEEMTKTKANYLRVQGILSPIESGKGEIRTNWQYTVDDIRRAILIELLKAREDLSVQESKVWLQNLEAAQNKGSLNAQEIQDISREISIPPLPNPVSSAYALLQNRTLGTLLASLGSGNVEVVPPECLIAIRILNYKPEASQITEVTWGKVQEWLQEPKEPGKGSWSLAVSDDFSKIYVYSGLSKLHDNRPEVIDTLPERNWYVVILQNSADLYYEILIGLPLKSEDKSVETIHQSLRQHMKENLPIQLRDFPGLSMLLEAAFVNQLSINEGTTLSVLTEIIAQASDAWDYCAILVPESAYEGPPKMVEVQEYSSTFPYALRNRSVDIEKSLTGWCYRYQQKAIVTSMTQNDLRMAFFVEEGRPTVAAAVPAIEGQKVVGVVYVAGHQQGTFSDELVAFLEAFGYICGDVIAREHVEVETVHNMNRLMTHPLVKPFDDLGHMLQCVAEEVREGVSPDVIDRSWIYLLTLNIQTTSDDIITQWLCQQGIDLVGNFLAYQLWHPEKQHPLQIGICKIKPNQYVYAILQAVELQEDTFKQCIIRLQKKINQMQVGRLAPDFYPSGVTFRFKDLSQKVANIEPDPVVTTLEERTQERLIAGQYFNRGHVALYSNDLDRAVSEFEDALIYVPQSWYGHKHLAEARMLQGTPRAIEQAIEHCRIAIGLNPAYASAHCLLADCLAYQSSFSFGEAILEYERALALEIMRSDFLIRYGLTLASMTSAEYQEAIRYVQYVWQKRQSSQLRTFKSHPWQEAIDKFDRVRSLSSIYDNDPEKEQEQRARYHYQRGYAYLQANMLDKAIEDFTVGRKLAPDDLQLAQAYSYALSLRRKEKTA